VKRDQETKKFFSSNSDWRKKAKEAFESVGLPSRKLERWKYTVINSDFNFRSGSMRETELIDLPRENDDYLKITRLSDLSEEKLAEIFSDIFNPKAHPMANFNTAYCESGFLIEIKKTLEDPLELNLSSGVSRIFLKINPGCAVKLIEKSAQNLGADSNHLMQCYLAEGASLKYCKILQSGEANLDHVEISAVHVTQEKNTYFQPCVWVNKNSGQSRLDISANLIGEGAKFYSLGAYDLSGKSHVDWHTEVFHRASNTSSEMRAKGILREESVGVFYAEAEGLPGNINISAHQKNHNLLLGDKASIFTQPVLKIHTDQITCTHGATVGQLDEAALFYLQSRGIPEWEAKNMLTEGFLENILIELRENFGERIL